MYTLFHDVLGRLWFVKGATEEIIDRRIVTSSWVTNNSSFLPSNWKCGSLSEQRLLKCGVEKLMIKWSCKLLQKASSPLDETALVEPTQPFPKCSLILSCSLKRKEFIHTLFSYFKFCYIQFYCIIIIIIITVTALLNHPCYYLGSYFTYAHWS